MANHSKAAAPRAEAQFRKTLKATWKGKKNHERRTRPRPGSLRNKDRAAKGTSPGQGGPPRKKGKAQKAKKGST